VWPTQLDDLRKALHSALHARPVSNRTALVCRTEQCALAAELVDNTEAVDTSVACSSLSRAVTAIVDIRQDRWSAQLVQLPQALDLVPSTRGVGSRRMSAGCPPQRALPAQLVDDAEARDASTLSCLPRCVGSRAVKLRQDSHPVLPAQLPQGSLVPLHRSLHAQRQRRPSLLANFSAIARQRCCLRGGGAGCPLPRADWCGCGHSCLCTHRLLVCRAPGCV